MKNAITLICLTLLFFSCHHINSSDSFLNYKNESITEIKLNDDMNQFILDFIKSNNNADCIYELYIDKKTEDEYFLTLFNLPNDSNYFTNHSPINYTSVGDKIVFIYSGIEDFIKKEEYFPCFKIKETQQRENISYETISKVIKRDSSYYVGKVGLPFTNIKFLPPIYLDSIGE